MTDTFAADDAALIAQTRAGDAEAFSTLWQRHEGAARRLAQSYARNEADRDDLVSVAFERVFTAIRNGAGPDDSFRAYLFVTLRRAAGEAAQRRNELPPQGVIDLALDADEAPLPSEERHLITQAFESLPDRWQTVLWHTAVEGRAPRDLAPRLGISANAAAAMAYRAREKLRQAYLQAHLQQAQPSGCEPFVGELGAYVRGALSARDHASVEAHVEQCQHCQALVAELQDVNSLLMRAMIPMVAPLAFKTAALLGAAGAVGAGGAALAASTGTTAGAAATAPIATTAASTAGAVPAAAAAHGAGAGAGAGVAGAGAGAAAGTAAATAPTVATPVAAGAAVGGGSAGAGGGAAAAGGGAAAAGGAAGGASAGLIAGAIVAVAAVIVAILAVTGAFSNKPQPQLATSPGVTTTTLATTTTSTPGFSIPLPPATTVPAAPSTTAPAPTTTVPHTGTTSHNVVTPTTQRTTPPTAPPPTQPPPTTALRAVLAMTGHYSIGNPGLTLSDFQIQNTGDANASNLVVTFAVDNGIVTPNANNGWSCGPPASVVTCSFDGVLVPGAQTTPLPLSAPDANHMSIGAGATGANNASVTFPQ